MINFKIYALAIVVIGLMAVVIVVLEKQIDTIKTERDQALSFAKSENNPVISYYRNELGRETAKTQMLDLSLRNARELINTDRLKFVQQFDAINSKLNNLESATRTTAKVVAQWELPLRDTFLISVDSTLLQAKTFQYSDNLNRITGTIIGNTITPSIDITVPLEGVVYWQRKKFLGLRIGRKQWSSDITSANPFVKIVKHEQIQIIKR